MAIIVPSVLVVQAVLLGNAAATLILPPGLSGANQYSESVPGPGGNERVEAGQGSHPAKTIGKDNAASLEALGPEGEAAARLAGRTAPAKAHPGHRKEARTGPANAGGGNDGSSGSSGAEQVLGQMTGTSKDGGMGLLLPLLIGAGLVGACTYLLNRRRTTRPQD